MKHPLRRIAVSTNAGAEDAVSALLERETGQTPGIHHDLRTGAVSVSAFATPSPREAIALRARLLAELAGLRGFGIDAAPARVSIQVVPPRDWSESWKRHFQPIDIAGKLLVRPTWSHRKPKRGQAMVELDPGLSFGTGQHATTRFCLEQVVGLRRTEGAQSLLDAGTGSGILALSAARLGYSPVEAFDYDPDCVRIARANCALNAIGGIRITEGDATRLPARPKAAFDVVCANLMHDVLIGARSRLTAHVAPGGTLVTAGILATQFDAVAKAYGGIGWEVAEIRTEGEWRSGSFRRSRGTPKNNAGQAARKRAQKSG